MLDDLTPEEIVALVHLCKVVDENAGAMVFVGDTLMMLNDVPGMLSFAQKLNEAGKREDVQKYLEEHYGESEEE